MNNAGVYTLCAQAIDVALTAEALTAITDLDGMSTVTLEAVMAYGSGGTSAVAVVQTSLDGSNWIDIARFDFAQTSARKIANLVASAAVGVASVASLSVEGVLQGVLGDTLRVKLTTVGTYVDTTLAVRAAVR
jgi:hypothetical protein